MSSDLTSISRILAIVNLTDVKTSVKNKMVGRKRPPSVVAFGRCISRCASGFIRRKDLYGAATNSERRLNLLERQLIHHVIFEPVKWLIPPLHDLT